MLTCLRVQNLAIIDELEVELGRGLNVLTGETGAGKSILVTALRLVLGGKGRGDMVRTGADKAIVEALFDISDDDALRERLAEAGLPGGDELLVRRVIHANGRTRAYVNGTLATAKQLGTLAEGLADISSQHQHHTLADARSHLDFLDAFGELVADRDRVREAYADVVARERALEELRAAYRDRADREDLLRYQLNEIDEVAPEPEEKDELESERAKLKHGTRLATAAAHAEQVLYAKDRSVSEIVGKILAEVQDAAELDPALEPHAENLAGALSQLEDVAAELGAYAREISLEPGRLAEVEDRLHRIQRLERKYGGSVEMVLEHRASAAAELDNLEHHEERLEEAESAHAHALQTASKRARALRKKRRKAASVLGQKISDELATLGMGGARVEVELAPLDGKGPNVDGARLSPTGIDRAEFLIAPNPGEKAQPLAKIASGGELSRAMLAIKRVLAGLGRAGTYVFDEVDSGVGGAVAEVIGRKLADVAAHHQVLCVTHLAQIAVYGDAHFQVAKEVDEGRTRSSIVRLDDKERLEELARMVGGVKITKRTRAAAAEMLEQARARE